MRKKTAPQDMSPAEFRKAGHELVDRISEFLESLPARPVTAAATPENVRKLIGGGPLPADGRPAGELLKEVSSVLFEDSLHNGHPRFFGYITGSAAPIGMLADLLAASVNPNLSIWDISPVASEIEAQSIRWIAELIGYPVDGDGITVSGGNMANILGFIAARTAKAPWDIRSGGLYADERRLTVYASRETHTWVEKAADVTGLGTDAIRWIGTDDQQRIDVKALERRIDQDLADGGLPFLVIGTAGNVSTGAIDPLASLAQICAARNLWFHVDGAYGAPAAALPEASEDFTGLALADSLAIDPHKWLYVPLEAAITFVRDPQALVNAFSFRPSYYALKDGSNDTGSDYYERGLQNSRGFRALKVWLGLRQAGKEGFIESIRSNIALAEHLHELAAAHPELEACTRNLSLTTFRYVPKDLTSGSAPVEQYLDELNQKLLLVLQKGGELFVSNAVVGGKYLLRACIVNFRTSTDDINALPEIVVREGRAIDASIRPDGF
jgi:glutamate/tyrosine decarboxylase-like PLP-dependent enzyme